MSKLFENVNYASFIFYFESLGDCRDELMLVGLKLNVNIEQIY